MPTPPCLCWLQAPLGFPEAASRWSSQWEGRGKGVFSCPTPHSPWGQESPFETPPPGLGCSLPAQHLCCGKPVLLHTHPGWILFPGRHLTGSIFQWCLKLISSRFKSMVLLLVHQMPCVCAHVSKPLSPPTFPVWIST